MSDYCLLGYHKVLVPPCGNNVRDILLQMLTMTQKNGEGGNDMHTVFISRLRSAHTASNILPVLDRVEELPQSVRPL